MNPDPDPEQIQQKTHESRPDLISFESDLVEMWSRADFGPVESCCDASYLEV